MILPMPLDVLIVSVAWMMTGPMEFGNIRNTNGIRTIFNRLHALMGWAQTGTS